MTLCASKLSFRLALAGASALSLAVSVNAQTVASADTTSGAASGEEITVTAQKRSERLIDVPSSITAISGEKLEAQQIHQLTDLVGTVPGLSISNYGGPGMNTIQLRGLAGSYLDDYAAPLVSTYVDDLPVGASTAAGRGNLFTLDLQPYDMEAIEVLRGPQGTLYGANSMGGLIKYTLKKPDLDSFEGRVGGDVSTIHGSGGVGYAPRAAVNIPIIKDKLAVRASGFYVHTPGYIDNIGTGKNDANKSKSYGGRVAVLYKATDNLRFHATALLQNSEADDTANVMLVVNTNTPVYGDQTTNTRFPQYITQKTRNYTFGGDLDLGFATLTSSAGWSQMNNYLIQDSTMNNRPFIVDPVGKVTYNLYSKLHKFTEETRVTSPENQPLSYTLGVFYTNERAGENTAIKAFTAAGAPLPNVDIYHGDSLYIYKEEAVFGNLTYKLTPKADITAGGRYSQYKQHGSIDTGGLNGTGVTPANTGKKTVGIYNVTGRYHFDRNLMAYAKIATGYRVGAFNNSSNLCSNPASSKPDRVTNIEGGVKGKALNNRVDFEATGFHINWTDLQLNIQDIQNGNNCYFVSNGGKAHSDGAELAAGLQAMPSLRIGGTLTYTSAHLVDDLPAAGGKAGDTLPLASKWQYSVTADYKTAVSDAIDFIAGGAFRYKGRYVSRFVSSGNPYPMKAQNLLDAYIGATLDRNVSARLYVKNLLNNYSYVGLQAVNEPTVGERAIPVQPRTVSLSLDYKF